MRHLPRTTRKVLVALYGGLLVLAISWNIWGHRAHHRSLENGTLARLTGITGTLAAQLDAGRVRQLLERFDARGMILHNTQDARYYVLHDALRKARVQSGLEAPLRIVHFDLGKQEAQVIVTSEERPAFREPITDQAILDRLLSAGPKATSLAMRLSTPRKLSLLTPLLDRQGRTVAHIHADWPTEAINTAVWERTVLRITASILLLLATGLLLFRSVGRWIRHTEEDHESLTARHADITASIAYAGKIQRALVPRPELFSRHFAEWFLLDRPKDVVSGDFHWFHELGPEVCLVAVADCTGHGLPGAMMAAIACSILNDLAAEDPLRDPATLLQLLNDRMVRTLNQSGMKRGAGDGMDIALCRVDRDRREIVFAGALRPLYWMHGDQLTVINGDRSPIGGAHHNDRHFTAHRIAYHPGDRIYLCSDGYVDQFGGPDRGRFMSRRFQELLIGGAHLPLQEQAGSLERAILDWKGGLDQLDDICVLGLKVA